MLCCVLCFVFRVSFFFVMFLFCVCFFVFLCVFFFRLRALNAIAFRDGPCSHRQSFMMKAIIPSKDGGIKTITSIPSGVDSNGVFVLDVSMPLGNRRPRNFPPTKKDQADAHCRVTNASHNSGIETYFLKTEMRQQQKRAMLFSIRRY